MFREHAKCSHNCREKSSNIQQKNTDKEENRVKGGSKGCCCASPGLLCDRAPQSPCKVPGCQEEARGNF